MPLNQGCIVQLQFPPQIVLSTSILTNVLALGLPSTLSTINGTIDTQANTYTVTNACPGYRDNSNQVIFYMTNITNPFVVSTTDTIEVYIFDSQNQMICSTQNTGPKVTTVPGSLRVQQIYSVDQQISEINQLANLSFAIQP